MANIKNSISMHDKMTPVFRSIIKSMDSTLKVMQQVDKQANKGVQSKAFMQAEKSISRANNALIKMQNHTDRADKSMKGLSNSSNRVATSMSNIGRGGFNLVNLSAALYLLKNIKQTVGSIMQAPDEALSTKARLGLFNESGYSNDQLYQQVYKTALETRTGLEETSNLATRILISGAMSGPGAAQGSLKVTGLINKALVAGGGTAEENKRALLQLSQGLASGNLQGDELRAIREQTPYLAKIMAEGMGKVDPKFKNTTIGDLKEMGGAGELTAERIIKAFFAMENEINDSFEKMPKTFGQAMTQVNSVWKYFLYMLGEGDGALAKINEKAWQFADFLSSPDGDVFLRQIAIGFTVIVDAMLWMVDMGVAAFNWLTEHADVVSASIAALGTIFVITGLVAAAAWIAAAWPLLLIAGLVGILVYSMLQFGYTSGEVLGGVVGGLMWLGAVAWNVSLAIIEGLALVGNIILLVFSGALAFIGNVFMAIAMSAAWVVGMIISGFMMAGDEVVYIIEAMGQGVLDVLSLLAKAIDFIFGSNLSATVDGWKSSISKLADVIHDKLSTDDMGILQEETWKNAPWMKLDWAGIDIFSGVGALDSLLLDPSDGWDKGMNLGDKIAGYGKNLDFTMGMDNLTGMLDNFDMGTVKMNGGDLDSVGKIKSDVNIAEEDLKLLRDIAAREFLMNLTSVTPSASVSFGDVRETADVNKILEVIENMVEEAFATSLVTD